MGLTDKQYGKSARPLAPTQLYVNGSNIQVTAQSSELNTLDKSVVGAINKLEVATGLTASSSARANVGITLPNKCGVKSVLLDIVTASTAGTINVGTPSSEANGDEDGYLAGVDITSTGLVAIASSDAGDLIENSNFNAIDVGSGGYALTYQNSTGPISSDFTANLLVEYIEFE